MKNYIKYMIFLAVTMFTMESKSQWTTLSFPSTQALTIGAFPDDLTGFVGSSFYPKMWRTLNGGITWDSITFTQNVKDIDFLSSLNGFVLIGGSSSFMVKKTTDGGTTWTDAILPAGNYYTTILFTSLTTGYAFTNDAIVLKTIDGGTNWSTLPIGGYTLITDKERIHADTILVTGWDGTFAYKGAVTRTYDGGASWVTIEHDSSYTTYNGSHFLTGLHGYVAHPNGWSSNIGSISETFDGGDNWTVIKADTSGEYQDVFMKNSMEGFVTIQKANGTGSIIKTIDGINWTSDYTTTYPVRKFYSNGNSLYGIGDGGLVIKNANINSVQELEIDDSDIYPNPTTGILHLNFNEPAQISIFDMMGKEVFSQQTNAGDDLNLQYLPAGMYVARFTIDHQTGSKKIIIEK